MTDQEQTRDEAPRDDSERILALVAQCLERLELEGPSGVEDICRRHPEYADLLRARIRKLEALGLLEGETPLLHAEPPKRLGPFKLGRRIARGGMGVIYLAEQRPLGRQVALKLVDPASLMVPGARQRFAREVKSIASLKHPAIVPVYTVGEDQGIPYFAMERIEGCTLADVIGAVHGRDVSTLSGRDFATAVRTNTEGAATDATDVESIYLFEGTWVDCCLRIVRQLADALDHAHRKNIIHRDIKPSNVMITPEGRVMLLDFGLASLLGSPDVTRTGALLGSLPYMSPEQLRGDTKNLDPRTDLYSLATTLYQLLTLRSPFVSENDQQTRSRILEGQAPPIRGIHSSVSWDVETVCLKAMDKDAARRYPTAQDFARDLDNLLARRAIEARRPSVWLRARRWGQRHPAWAVAFVALLLAMVGGPLFYAHAEREKRLSLAREREETARQRDRARENFGLVVQALDRLGGLVHVGLLDDSPRFRELFLEELLAIYEGLPASDDPQGVVIRHEARTMRTLAEVLYSVGNERGATGVLQECLETLQQWLDGPSEDPVVRTDLAYSLGIMGDILLAVARFEEAEGHYRRALREMEHLAATGHDVSHERELLLQGLGWLLSQTQRSEQGLPLLVEAVEGMRLRIQDGGSGRQTSDEFCETLTRLAICRDRQGQSLQAIDDLHEARDHLLVAHERFDHWERLEARIASNATTLGELYRRSSKIDEALAIHRESVQWIETLLQKSPRMVGRLTLASIARTNLGRALDIAGQPNEGLESLNKSLQWIEKAQQISSNPTILRTKAEALYTRGEIYRVLEHYEEARDDLRLAYEVFEEFYDRIPNQTDADRHLNSIAWGNAMVSLEVGDYEGAVELALELPGLHVEHWQNFRRAALVFERAAQQAQYDTELDEEEREDRIREYVNYGLEALEEALEGGFIDISELRKEESLEALMARDAFEAFIDRWESDQR